jgi:hypothetical protein
LRDAAAREDAAAFFFRFRATFLSGNGFRRSAVIAWAVTQTGVCALVLE